MRENIQTIHAREILDSRGNPTICSTVILEDGTMGAASVPSGASTGSHEAFELRDGDLKRYGGLGVLKAVRNVNTVIARALKRKNIFLQREIDQALCALDGTLNKRRLGANAILSVSLACAHAGANFKHQPLYQYLRSVYDLSSAVYRLPFATMNILNGGAHAGWILDFQEFMIVPQQKKIRERVRCGAEVFHALGLLLKKKGFQTFVGDEGGYAVPLKKNEEAFQMILEAVRAAGYSTKDVHLAMDPATSELYNKKTQRYELKMEQKKLTSDQMIAMWESWVKKYPIISLEDGLAEDDWNGWARLTGRLGKKIALVGDDLFVTNTDRLTRGIKEKVGNAILIKVNQVGTLSEAMDAIFLAKKNGYQVSISHRSGETEDTTIADIAVAAAADFIKTGSLSRSERVAKYNRLLEIEEEVS